MRRILLLLLLLCVRPAPQAAAQPFGIAWWDVERLYDTLPSPFHNDTDYTPGGRLRWSGERYRRKIEQTAALIDSLSLPVVALFGVENEAVVRDLVRSCRNDYSYLHRTLNRIDGLDFALLYFGDRFFPHYTEPGNGYLYVEGTFSSETEIPCDTLGLLLCCDPETSRRMPDLLRRERPGARLLLAGRFDPADALRQGLHDATARAERAGRGNVFRRGRWLMRDRIAADTALRVAACDLYMRRWLLDPERGTPLATYEAAHYRGGISSRLPIFIYLAPQ